MFLHLLIVMFVFSEPTLNAPNLPLQRQTWMTTFHLTACLRPPLPWLSTRRTMVSSNSTKLQLLRPPFMTHPPHVAPRSQTRAASITSLAATRRTLCCFPSLPPHLRLIRTPLTFTSSTRPPEWPRWRHRYAIFPLVMTSRPHLGQTLRTRFLAHCQHRQGWEAQRVREMYPLQGHLSLCSVPPQESHHPLLNAHLRTPILFLAQPRRQMEIIACQLMLGARLYAATLLALTTVHDSVKVCAEKQMLALSSQTLPFKVCL